MRTTVILLVALIGLTLVLTAGIAPAFPLDDKSAPDFPRGAKDVQQLIFFAVVEGLYRDGVDTETAQLLATIDKSGVPRFFVYGCPLCMPAIDAVRLYAGRPEFYASKSASDTFGPGLPKDVLSSIRSEDETVARAAFQKLIQNWTDQALDRRNLNDTERREWHSFIGGLREKGNAMLESYLEGPDGRMKDAYEGWKQCPVCEGSNEGSGM